MKKSITLLTTLSILFGGFFTPTIISAAGPETLPLLQQGNLEYLGAFRLPRGGDSATESFSFGGNVLAYDPADGGLFASTRGSYVAKVRIPTPIKSPNIESLPFATFMETFHDPLEGGLSALPQSGIHGLLVDGGKLYGAASIYYDASNSARVSHFSRSTNLTTPSATPLKALWQADRSGYVGGWLATVPSEWQSLLGGSIVSGSCCVPIVSRTSFGPSAFAWHPADFTQSLIPATPLLYYPSDHPNLGPWGSANAIYGGTTVIGGMVIPANTRSLLYFGANGTGSFCYGIGGASGGECFDPLSSAKGQHAYPYNYQVWAYDLLDLAKAKSKQITPWDIKPYATWQITFPNSFMSLNGIGGVAYDQAHQIIYLSQVEADTDGYSSRALIHAYKVKVADRPAEKLAYNKVNETKPEPLERREVVATSTASTTDTYLDHRDVGRGWLWAYGGPIGYGRYLLRTLLSYLKARS